MIRLFSRRREMTRVFYIPLFILISFHTLLAQTARPKKNSIGFHTGVLSSSVKDELASSLTYKGSGAPIQLSYRFMGNKNRHSVSLSYSKSKLFPTAELPYGQHSLDHFQFDLAYSYHRFLASLFRDRVKLYLGGVWDNHVSARELYYIWDMSEIYGELISSLDISPLLEFKMSKKNQLTYQLALPVMALVIRSPYAQKGIVIPKITTVYPVQEFTGPGTHPLPLFQHQAQISVHLLPISGTPESPVRNGPFYGGNSVQALRNEK